MEKLNKVLFAGPFVGEFGWELFCWQGFIRRLSRKYASTIVATRPDRKFIYDDFAEVALNYYPATEQTNNAKCKGDVLPDDYYDKIRALADRIDFDIIPSQVRLIHWSSSKGYYATNKKYIDSPEQEFRMYGPQDMKHAHVVIHARDTHKMRSGGRNWAHEKWDLLCEHVSQVAPVFAIGTKQGSYCPPTAGDLRGHDMRVVCMVLSTARLVMGGSSGPMHLAALCNAPMFVWSHPVNRRRYLEDWNPFGVDVTFYDEEGWNPSLKKIMVMTDSLLGQ